MKPKIAILTTISLLFNLFTPQPVSAEYPAGDLERLYWLCSDYQLPIKGYVIEAWFVLLNRPGIQNALEQQLQLEQGAQKGVLLDGSKLNYSVQRSGQKFYIELQLITEHQETAQHYYALWQNFADQYRLQKPVGITVIAELPELLDESAKKQLSGELQQGLQAGESHTVALDAMLQVSGYSPQLTHWLEVGGEKINFNFAILPKQEKTAVYLGTPVIYQQY